MSLDREWALIHAAAERMRREREAKGLPPGYRDIGRRGSQRPEQALARLKRRWASREGAAGRAAPQDALSVDVGASSEAK